MPASGCLVGFVPDHSDGVAADSHRLPGGPLFHEGSPNSLFAATVSEAVQQRKRPPHRRDTGISEATRAARAGSSVASAAISLAARSRAPDSA
jgi:hypothetical protein